MAARVRLAAQHSEMMRVMKMLWDDDQDPKTYEDVLQNTLVISQLDRTYHDSTFECRAINNNVTQPKR